MIYIISKMTWPESQDNQSSIDLVGQNMQLMSLIPSRLIYEVKSGCTRLGPFSINITDSACESQNSIWLLIKLSLIWALLTLKSLLIST